MRNTDELRAYQDRIATFLYEHNEAICVARPGGGKTVAALTAVAELQRDRVIRHALVLAPKRVARQVWPDELRGWTHLARLKHAGLFGSPMERARQLSMCEADVTIAGLDIVDWLLGAIDGLPADHPVFDLLIIDEISRLRDPTSVRAKLLDQHSDRFRMVWGLSGTLRPNGPQDMFVPAKLVTRRKLWGKSFYKWRKQHFYPVDFHGYDWQPLPTHEAIINAEIAPHIVTLREDEYPQLPELSVLFDRITLPPKAREAYATMHRKLMATVSEKNVVAVNSAVATGKLAQIANGFLYDKDQIDGYEHSKAAEGHEIHDEKRNWLADIIENAAGPTLLIYEYLHDLRMIQDLLPNVPFLGAGAPDAQADRHIRKWNEGKLPFMALHPASGGHGLNLQFGGADMAWLAPCWSAEFWEQTIARLHRPNQTRPVIVRVCVASGTVDEMKLDRVHHKMTAQQAFERYLMSFNQGATER